MRWSWNLLLFLVVCSLLACAQYTLYRERPNKHMWRAFKVAFTVLHSTTCHIKYLKTHFSTSILQSLLHRVRLLLIFRWGDTPRLPIFPNFFHFYGLTLLLSLSFFSDLCLSRLCLMNPMLLVSVWWTRWNQVSFRPLSSQLLCRSMLFVSSLNWQCLNTSPVHEETWRSRAAVCGVWRR